MSRPLPTDVRVKFVRPYAGRRRYQAWLEPEHRFLGVVQKVSSDEWSAYLPDGGLPVASKCGRGPTIEVRRSSPGTGSPHLHTNPIPRPLPCVVRNRRERCSVPRDRGSRR